MKQKDYSRVIKLKVKDFLDTDIKIKIKGMIVFERRNG
jgi:hypothetical protein